MERSAWGKAQAENVQRPTPNSESFREQAVQRSSTDKSVQEILTILHKWGIHTLGQFAALDKQHVGARLGPEAIRMWERANGQSKRVLKLIRPPETFEESFEFEREIETAEPLLFMLRRFLKQLVQRLRAIYLVAKELKLQITFADKQIYECAFKIPQPTNDVDLLFRMLHTHLENFRSEHPIVAVALSAQPIKPAKEQFGLFETTLRNPHQLSETLARLTALLGGERVGTPVLEETHRPDAFRMEPFAWQIPMICAADTAASTEEKKPPLRRFRPAPSASVLLEENIPAHVRSTEIWGKVIDQRGPYFLSGNWWDEKSWARAEWDLQLENGELIRAHEASPSSNYRATEEGIWKVDGIYD
jgi:protein ImuB